MFSMLILSIVAATLSLVARSFPLEPRSKSCQPFKMDSWTAASVLAGRSTANAPFVSMGSNARTSYAVGSGGLELLMERPAGTIKTSKGVNDKVAEGSTINSTFTILHGVVSFEVSAPAVPGAVTAVILIANEHDEIDVEILGGYPGGWQTNTFASGGKSLEPMYNVFSSTEKLPNGSVITETHKYTVDWDENRIIWSIDDIPCRTLRKEDTVRNGALHYPSHAARIQLGIWDASSPAGTAEWARGPIDWDKAPAKMKAVIKSVSVDCP